MNKFLVYLIGIISIVFPGLSYLFLISVAIGSRWLSLNDMSIIWWIIFIILPITCIIIQCIYFKKRILRKVLYISIPLSLSISWLVVFWTIQDNHSAYDRDKMRFWWCFAETVKAFSETKNITLIKNIDQSYEDSFVWVWSNFDRDNICKNNDPDCNIWMWNQSQLDRNEIIIKKIGPNKYTYNENYKNNENIYVWSINKNGKYILFWEISIYNLNDVKLITESVLKYQDTIRLYITSEWLIPVFSLYGTDEYRCYKLYTK